MVLAREYSIPGIPRYCNVFTSPTPLACQAASVKHQHHPRDYNGSLGVYAVDSPYLHHIEQLWAWHLPGSTRSREFLGTVTCSPAPTPLGCLAALDAELAREYSIPGIPRYCNASTCPTPLELIGYHNWLCSMRQSWARTFDARFGCGLSLPQPCQFDATGLGSNLRCEVWVWLVPTTTIPVRCNWLGLEPLMRGLGVACPYHNHPSSMQLAWARTFDARFGCGTWCNDQICSMRQS
jgi:hypothetical protein